jgi:ATP-dependent DNA helicase RecG
VLGKDPGQHLEGAFIEVQKYANAVGAPPVPIGPAIKISRPARQLIEEAAKIVEQNLPVSRTYSGVRMIEVPTVPLPIIRETITNAVAHRNYQSNEHIRIRIFDDGFDISNPAVLTRQMWMDIQTTHTTYHPNEGLYTFLKPALLYEGRGEGIWKIKEELQRLGRVAPEFKVIGEAPSTFYVRIGLSPTKARDARFQRINKMLMEREEITTSEVMKRLNVSRVTAIQMLNLLVEQGLLEHRGAARASKYIVKIKPF